jgi:hypothetical protein
MLKLGSTWERPELRRMMLATIEMRRGLQGHAFANMTDLGKLLIFFGGTLVLVGIVVVLFGKFHLPIGRLPGDIVYRGKNTTVYFPLATSIVLSVVLTVLLYVVGKWRR